MEAWINPEAQLVEWGNSILTNLTYSTFSVALKVKNIQGIKVISTTCNFISIDCRRLGELSQKRQKEHILILEAGPLKIHTWSL